MLCWVKLWIIIKNNNKWGEFGHEGLEVDPKSTKKGRRFAQIMPQIIAD